MALPAYIVSGAQPRPAWIPLVTLMNPRSALPRWIPFHELVPTETGGSGMPPEDAATAEIIPIEQLSGRSIFGAFREIMLDDFEVALPGPEFTVPVGRPERRRS